MLKLTREAMGNANYRKVFEAIVEIDETRVGGKPRERNRKDDDDKDRMEQDLKTAISLDRKWAYHVLVDKDLIRNQDVVKKMLGL